MSLLADPVSTTPRPPLTWTHLFASETSYVWHAGPPWFADLLGTLPSEGSRRVAVIWNDRAPLDSYLDGMVAINSRHFPAEALRKSGYRYVRHFAVLPSLRQARWYVPLDSPAISSAAMSLYTPSKFSASLKRSALRLAMHTRLPLWYRDHIWIVQRDLPPIESAVNRFLGGQDVRWALSSGAPYGARNRKASALILSRSGTPLAYAKLARSDIARRIIANEAKVLERLDRIPVICDSVPRVVYRGEVDDVSLLAQTPLNGPAAPIGITPMHERFLQSLQTTQRVPAANTATVARIPERLAALQAPRPDLLAIYQRLLPTLQSFSVPLTIVHGDFAPWNLRLHQGRLGAFDWEYGEPNGLPLLDEMHYRLQYGWLVQNWDAAQARRQLHDLAAKRPLDLLPEHVDAIATVYLLDALARLYEEGYSDEQDVIEWHRKLLDLYARGMA